MNIKKSFHVALLLSSMIVETQSHGMQTNVDTRKKRILELERRIFKEESITPADVSDEITEEEAFYFADRASNKLCAPWSWGQESSQVMINYFQKQTAQHSVTLKN